MNAFYGAPAAAALLPTTADALLFLSQVSPQGAGPAASTSSSGLAGAFPASSLAAPRASSSSALSGENALAKAYQSLGASKTSPAGAPEALWVTSSLEAEPFAGLRLSVRPHPGMAPLGPRQKAAALECIEHLWAAAMASGSASPNPAPRDLGAETRLQTSSASTTPPKDQP